MLHTTGVTNSVSRVVAHLEAAGHEVMVIAPRAPGEPDDGSITLLRSFALPSYPDVRLTAARAKTLEGILRDFVPDVVHLASPFVLGWQALRAADHLGIPTVAIYQTDIPGFAQRYGLPLAVPALTQHVARIHKRATLTLAPSSAAISELEAIGVDRLKLWARGVDGERYRPSRRSRAWRRRHAPDGEVVIGYVGRLAPEKQVEHLKAVADLPGTKLVIVGDGPSRPALEKLLPDADFLGFQSGDELAESYASFDVFVHPGENETFCRGWADRLASLLAGSTSLRYANLAVRSRTIPDVLQRQIPRALELEADLVTILIGGNDLAGPMPSAARLADSLRPGVARLRATGCEVLLIVPFVPPSPFLRTLHRRTAGLAPELRRVAAATGARVLDISADPEWLEPRLWDDDRVHLSSHGHRVLAYRAAEALGMPGARELGDLDVAMHDEPMGEQLSTPAWMWQHVRPWLGRRLRGRTAGDGRMPKHHTLVPVVPADPSGHPAAIDH